MKVFKFKEEKYQDLNSLGLAFIDNFKEAMEVVSTKPFLKFCKQFKGVYDKVVDILYSTRYTQNEVSLIIYEFTKEHKLVILGKDYSNIKDVLKNADSKGIQLFASEFGFTKTICKTLEDEKLKINLKAFEKSHNSEFAIKYMKEYYNVDSIENNFFNNLLISSEELFKRTTELFKNDEYLMYLAHKFNLDEVLNIKQEACPVFDGLSLISGEISEESAKAILNDGFYLWIFDHVNDYKFIGGKAKAIRNRILIIKKLMKKLKNMSLKDLIGFHKELYKLYIRVAELYESEKIVVKSDESYALTIAYCGTYIPQAYVALHLVKLSGDNEEKVSLVAEKYQYNLDKLEKTIKQHFKFAGLGIFFSVFLLIYIVVAYVLKTLAVENITLFIFTWGESNIPFISYAVGVALLLIMSIVVYSKSKVDNKRYNQLCKLKYYNNNISILNAKESAEFNRLNKRESRIARSIDSFYQLYGGIGLAGLSLAISFITYSLLSIFPIIPNSAKAFTDPFIKLVFAPACVSLVIGVLRHKKTCFSIFFSVILSIGLCALLIYLVGAGIIV